MVASKLDFLEETDSTWKASHLLNYQIAQYSETGFLPTFKRWKNYYEQQFLRLERSQIDKVMKRTHNRMVGCHEAEYSLSRKIESIH